MAQSPTDEACKCATKGKVHTDTGGEEGNAARSAWSEASICKHCSSEKERETAAEIEQVAKLAKETDTGPLREELVKVPAEKTKRPYVQGHKEAAGRGVAVENRTPVPIKVSGNLGTSDTRKGEESIEGGCDEEDDSYSDDSNDEVDEDDLAALDVRPGLHSWLE